MKNFSLKTAQKYLNLLVVMVCSFVGVGFVSGAEIYEFFVRFGNWFYLGIAVFFALCFCLCYKILVQTESQKHNIAQNNNFNLKMQKNNQIKPKNTFLIKNYARQIIIFLNVLLISAAMFAGLKTLILNLFNNNYFLLLFACFAFAYALCVIGVRGLEKVDIFVLVFVAVVAVEFVRADCFDFKTMFSASSSASFGAGGGEVTSNFVLAICSVFFACLYIFMNILQFEPLAESSGLTFSKRRAAAVSFVFSFSLSVTLLIFVLFFRAHTSLSGEPMPFLKYFSERGGFISKIYSFGLLISLLTTLITCLIGSKKLISRRLGWGSFASSSLAVGLALVLSVLPFGFFISIVYPILGVLNFVVFAFL